MEKVFYIQLVSLFNNNFEIVKFLFFEFKSDSRFVKIKDNGGFNILHLACYNNCNFEIVRFLYNQFKKDNKFIGSLNIYGYTPLSYLSESKMKLLKI